MLFVSVAVGPVKIPLTDLGRMLFDLFPGLQLEADWSRTFATIVYQIRLPNTALMALAGMALGGSGAAYQGLFRNPLADPYIIGVASGAGLGAVLAMSANWPVSLLGMATVPLAAFGDGNGSACCFHRCADHGCHCLRHRPRGPIHAGDHPDSRRSSSQLLRNGDDELNHAAVDR